MLGKVTLLQCRLLPAMQNEETKMLTRQGTEELLLPAAPGINAPSTSDALNQALPAQNGQGDTLPLSSGILQVHA